MTIQNERTYFDTDTDVEDNADLTDKFLTIRIPISQIALACGKTGSVNLSVHTQFYDVAVRVVLRAT